MKSIFRTYLIGILLCCGLLQGKSQGCSDAGACSMESFTPNAGVNDMLNEVSIGFNVGAADHNISVWGAQIGYMRKLGSSLSIDTRVTHLSQSGNGISESGLGDVFLMVNHRPSSVFTISAGVKIPTHKADKKSDGVDLPMDYQSSLGTLDAIVGVAWQKENWLLALGYQQPLIQNDNKFYPFEWDHPLAEFQSTRNFERKADVLLRITRIIKLTDKLTITPGLLPIYHVAADEFEATPGAYASIEGSEGLTLNATARFIFALTEKSKLNFSIGFPLIVREARPDGLTRSFVAGVEYGYAF